jgi:hypothetical protein
VTGPRLRAGGAVQIRIVIPRVMQDAGRELQLHVGKVYDLPAVVGQALIATGAAERVETARVIRAPENTAAAAPETRRVQRAS